jgi:hypothetical protein
LARRPETARHLEQRPLDATPNGAIRGHVDFPGIGLCEGDEVGNILGWDARMHLQHEWVDHRSGNRRNIFEKVERKIFVEGGVYGVADPTPKQRVSVWRRMDHRLSRNTSVSTGLVFNDDFLTKSLRQPAS